MNPNLFDSSKKTVYVLFENDGNHDIFYDKKSIINGYAIPYVYLREEIERLGYNFRPTFDYAALAYATDVAYIISITCVNHVILQSVNKFPKERCFLFVLEPWTTHGQLYNIRLSDFFGKIFVMFDDIIDKCKYFKFYHPVYCETITKNIPDFEHKKFCVMVQSNHSVAHPQSEYEERRKAASFFDNTGEFDLYGAHWEGYRSWRGKLKTDKLDVIKNYKFYLAYENMKDQRGYMTERLFEAFYAQCIPIYLGPSNITDYVPAQCFINRLDFSSYDDLYLFLKSMTQSTYKSYIMEGQAFLQSEKVKPFTSKQFAKTITENMV